MYCAEDNVTHTNNLKPRPDKGKSINDGQGLLSVRKAKQTNSAYAYTMTDKLKNGTNIPLQGHKNAQSTPVYKNSLFRFTCSPQIIIAKFHFYAQLDNILSREMRMAGLTVRIKSHL